MEFGLGGPADQRPGLWKTGQRGNHHREHNSAKSQRVLELTAKRSEEAYSSDFDREAVRGGL